MEQQNLVDLTFLKELSGDDPQYMYDVLEIFIGTVPEGLEKLDNLISNTEDWEAIYKQAHFLKSSTGIIKIGDIYSQLEKTESLARKNMQLQKDDAEYNKIKQQVPTFIRSIRSTFNQAYPFLISERDKHKSSLG